MTMLTALAPPKEPLFLSCSKDSCTNKFQPYHGKVGCLCYECDDRTPVTVKRKSIGIND